MFLIKGTNVLLSVPKSDARLLDSYGGGLVTKSCLTLCSPVDYNPPGFSVHGFKFNHMLAQMVKNLPAVQETWVQSMGWENPLEKEMATHSTILDWKLPWTEESGLQSMGSQRVGHERLTLRREVCSVQLAFYVIVYIKLA